jgi:ketosteroid isomerase-like protein
VEWETPGTAEFPLAGKRRGHQQVMEFFQTLNSAFEVQRFEPETFVAEGDRVIVLGRETTLIRATGKVLEVPWAHAFTLRNGKIVALQEYVDTAAVVAELRSAQAVT